MRYITRRTYCSPQLDFFGMSASLLCALHCAAMPLVLGLGLSGSLALLHHPLVEWSLIGFSLSLASWSLIRSHILVHGRWEALRILLLGAALLVAGRFSSEILEAPTAVAGGLAVATAHWLNLRLVR